MNPKLKSQAVALANKVHIASGSGAFPEEKKQCVAKDAPCLQVHPACDWQSSGEDQKHDEFPIKNNTETRIFCF